MSFVYRHVKVERVIDGDTVLLAIDMGNCITWRENFRLNGIDTPEKGMAGATEATEFLSKMLAKGLCAAETHKPDKYGRWLVDLYVPAGDGGGELHVNTFMVFNGFAMAYQGGKKP